MTYYIFRPSPRYPTINGKVKEWWDKVGKLNEEGDTLIFPNGDEVSIAISEIEKVSDFEGSIRWELWE